MKDSTQTHKRRRLVILGLVALGVVPIGTLSQVAVQKDAPVAVTEPAVQKQEPMSPPDFSYQMFRPNLSDCCEHGSVDPCQCYGEPCYPGRICACANEQCVNCKLSQKSSNVHYLGVLRQFRDQLLNKTETGRRYIRLYYFHSPAVTQVLLTEPVLATRAFLLTARLVPGLQRWVSGSSKQSVVNASLVTEIAGFSESLAAAADRRGRPLLAGDIRREITPLTDRSLIGKTYPEAWEQISKEDVPPPITKQPDLPKFEISPQFSFLSLNRPTPIIGQDQQGIIVGHSDAQGIIGHADQSGIVSGHADQQGIGVRFTYNATRNVALEAAGNFFPKRNSDLFVPGGSVSQMQFGVKAGERFGKFGIFGKARPGLIRFSDVNRLVGTQSISVNPALPPVVIGLLNSESKTYFLTEVGGVVEYYPSRHIVIRFDLGDTIIRYGTRPGLSPSSTIIQLPAETKHNLLFNAGVGFRF